MKKDTELKRSHNDEYKIRLQQKVEQQLALIESTVHKLLDGVKVEELNAKDRLIMASRYMNLHQHAVALGDTLEGIHSEKQENSAIIAITQKMRGEQEKKEDTQVVDSNIKYVDDNRDD